MKQDMLVILDLGSVENTVVARAVRALGVYSEIYPHDITLDELKKLPNVKGILVSGGENEVVDGEKICVSDEIWQSDFPILTACHDRAKRGEVINAWPQDEDELKAVSYTHLLYRFGYSGDTVENPR